MIFGEKMEPEEKTKIEFKPFDILHLDNDENPRLPVWLVGATDREIADFMVLKGNVLALMGSIGEQGFFPGEPLLVTKADGKDGLVVVEGNRRLAAVMLLHNPRLASVKRVSVQSTAEEARIKPVEIPVIIYPTRGDIVDYLGYRHITGIKEWSPYSKARYLRKLYTASTADAPEGKFRELAKKIGSRSDYVRKLLCALTVYDKINDSGYLIGKNAEEVSFSLLTTALGYANIQEFLGLQSGEEIAPEALDDEHLREFSEWIFDKKEGRTRLGESRSLSMLASVVGNREALREFRSNAPLKSAFFVSGGAKNTVLKAIDNAEEKLDIAYRYAKNITLDSHERMKLDTIIDTAKAIKK